MLLICQTCGKEHSGKYASGRFCSRSCSNSYSTKAKRAEINAKVSKTLTAKKVIIQCKYCGCSTEKTKQKQQFCSVKCGASYRYKDLDKTSLSYYRSQCAFKFSLNDFPDEFDFKLIEEFKWYKAKNHGNNLNGISRDHMFSCRSGFDLGIDPKIISHPANCQLLRHNHNVSKGGKSSITLEELFLRIAKWDDKYNLRGIGEILSRNICNVDSTEGNRHSPPFTPIKCRSLETTEIH